MMAEDEDVPGPVFESARVIDSYVNLIPARFYLPSADPSWEDAEEEEEDEAPGKGGGKGGKGQGAKKNAAKRRAFRFDPANMRSTTQRVEEMAQTQRQKIGKKAQKTAKRLLKRKAAEQAKAEGAAGQSGPKGARPAGGLEKSGSGALDPKGARVGLQEKLHRRIQELKDERRRKQSEMDKKRKARQMTEAGAGETRGSSAKDPSKAGSKKSKTVVEEDLDYGTLEFQAERAKLPFEATTGRPGSKARRVNQEIKEQERTRRRVAEIGDANKKEKLLQEMRMEKALRRASGEKVKDDLDRLKKTRKSIEKSKLKMKASWKSRQEEMVKGMADKQDQRKKNLKERVDSKKEKKLEKQGPGRVERGKGGKGNINKQGRRGFEGKRQGYLNKE